MLLAAHDLLVMLLLYHAGLSHLFADLADHPADSDTATVYLSLDAFSFSLWPMCFDLGCTYTARCPIFP